MENYAHPDVFRYIMKACNVIAPKYDNCLEIIPITTEEVGIGRETVSREKIRGIFLFYKSNILLGRILFPLGGAVCNPVPGWGEVQYTMVHLDLRAFRTCKSIFEHTPNTENIMHSKTFLRSSVPNMGTNWSTISSIVWLTVFGRLSRKLLESIV